MSPSTKCDYFIRTGTDYTTTSAEVEKNHILTPFSTFLYLHPSIVFHQHNMSDHIPQSRSSAEDFTLKQMKKKKKKNYCMAHSFICTALLFCPWVFATIDNFFWANINHFVFSKKKLQAVQQIFDTVYQLWHLFWVNVVWSWLHWAVLKNFRCYVSDS